MEKPHKIWGAKALLTYAEYGAQDDEALGVIVRHLLQYSEYRIALQYFKGEEVDIDLLDVLAPDGAMFEEVFRGMLNALWSGTIAGTQVTKEIRDGIWRWLAI